MAEEALVESRVRDSADLVSALDAQGDAPTVALWYYYSDSELWRVLIAGPTFDPLLPRDESQAYRKIAAAIQRCSLDSLTIADVKPVRTDDPILQAARFMMRTPGSAIVRAYFQNNTINGLFIKEMIVLRAA
jgi:hypothetical protein